MRSIRAVNPGKVLVSHPESNLGRLRAQVVLGQQSMEDLPTAGPVESLNIDHGELHIAVDDVEV